MSDYNRLIDLTLIRLEEHFEKIGGRLKEIWRVHSDE